MKIWKRITAGILCIILMLQAIPSLPAMAESAEAEQTEQTEEMQETVEEEPEIVEPEKEPENISETETTEEKKEPEEVLEQKEEKKEPEELKKSKESSDTLQSEQAVPEAHKKPERNKIPALKKSTPDVRGVIDNTDNTVPETDNLQTEFEIPYEDGVFQGEAPVLDEKVGIVTLLADEDGKNTKVQIKGTYIAVQSPGEDNGETIKREIFWDDKEKMFITTFSCPVYGKGILNIKMLEKDETLPEVTVDGKKVTDKEQIKYYVAESGSKQRIVITAEDAESDIKAVECVQNGERNPLEKEEDSWCYTYTADYTQDFLFEITNQSGGKITVTVFVIVDGTPPRVEWESVQVEGVEIEKEGTDVSCWGKAEEDAHLNVRIEEENKPVTFSCKLYKKKRWYGWEEKAQVAAEGTELSIDETGTGKIALPAETFNCLENGDYRIAAVFCDAAGNKTEETELCRFQKKTTTFQIAFNGSGEQEIEGYYKRGENEQKFLVQNNCAEFAMIRLNHDIRIRFTDLKGLRVKKIVLAGEDITQTDCYDAWNHELTLKKEKIEQYQGMHIPLTFEVEYADSFCISYQDGIFRQPVGNLLNPQKYGTVVVAENRLTVAGAENYFAKAFVDEEEWKPEKVESSEAEQSGIENTTFAPPEGSGILIVKMQKDTENPEACILKRNPRNPEEIMEEAIKDSGETNYYTEAGGRYRIQIKAKDRESGIKKIEYAIEEGEYGSVPLRILEKECEDTWYYVGNINDTTRTLYIWVSDYYGHRIHTKVNLIEDNDKPEIDPSVTAEGGIVVDDIYGRHCWNGTDERSLIIQAYDASEPIKAIYKIYRIEGNQKIQVGKEEYDGELKERQDSSDVQQTVGEDSSSQEIKNKSYTLQLPDKLFREKKEDAPEVEWLENGTYQIDAEFYDDAGNHTEVYEDFYRFILDRSKPEVTLNGKKEYWLKPSEQEKVEIEIKTNQCFKEIEYAVTEQEPESGTEPEDLNWTTVQAEPVDNQTDKEQGTKAKVSILLPQKEAEEEISDGTRAYYIYVRDKMGNQYCSNTPVICHIDGKAPEFSGVEIEKENVVKRMFRYVFGIFSKKEETLIIKADVSDSPAAGSEYRSEPDVEKVELYYLPEEKGKEENPSYEELQNWKEHMQVIKSSDVVKSDENVTTYQFKLNMKENNRFYRLFFVAEDKAGNRTIQNLTSLMNDGKEGIVMTDDKKPVITKEFKDAATKPDYEEKKGKKIRKWYAKNRDIAYDFKIKDEESGIFSTGVSVNGETIHKDDNGNILYDASQMEDDDRQKMEQKLSYCIRPEQGDIAEDGSYQIEFQAEDNAGNVQQTSDIIYVDRNAPKILDMTFNNGEKDKLTTVPTQYGYFFQKAATATITATDYIGASKITGSGVKVIYCRLIPADGTPATELQATAVLGKEGIYTAQFQIPEGFKGQLQLTAEDYVGQSSRVYNPKGAVVENQKQHEKTSKAEIQMPKTEYKDSEGNLLYNRDITLELQAADSWSGLKESKYQIKEHNSQQNLSEGVLQVASVFQEESGTWNSQLSGDSDWQIPNNLELNLVTQAQKKVAVSADSNHVTAVMGITDNAGNQSQAQNQVFSIDKTAPQVTIEYDNNQAENETYYKEKRVATITVTDANFSAKNCKLSITGPECAVSEWKHKPGNGCNGKVHTGDCQYSCQAFFAEDGDYTVSFRCRDLAGNEAAYNRVDQFTIDTVKPVIRVSYDNNDARGETYYSKERTATLQVEDKNFNPAETKVDITAQKEGAAIATPNVSAFTQKGDIWSATVHFAEDGDYTFQMAATDKAGNVGEEYAREAFTVDQTQPELIIEGVEPDSANQGVVAPVIRSEDINIDAASVSVSLKGANHGAVAYESKSQQNGKQVEIALNDFKHSAEIDDLYTLEVKAADKAGNEKTESIQFSVNRFGSVYILEDKTKEVVDKFYTNQEPELVVTEVNVDTLQFEEITYSLDGTITTMEKGKDYEVKNNTNEADWKMYEYHIHKQNFEKEGSYVVSIYSEDLAQNKSSNKAKGKEISFVVDKTAPTVVVAGVENNGQYVDANRNITIDSQDNILLDRVEVYADDVMKKSAERKALLENNGQMSLSLAGSNQVQKLHVEAKDAAGNVSRTPDIRFLITQNLFVQWVSNVPLFVGSVSVTATAGAAGVFMLRRRKLRLKV